MSKDQELGLPDVKPPLADDAKDTVNNGDVHKETNGEVVNHSQSDEDKMTVKDKCKQLQENCKSCCIPCLTSQNPLPENANIFQKIKHGFMLPPHGNLASYVQFAVVCLQIWIVLYTLTHVEALPGGNLFSLLVLFVCCAVGGYLISFAHLPPLLGMLIVGLLLRNVPVIKSIGENIDTKWASALRKIALTVILTRAGLGLDIVKLRKLSWAVLRLAFLPCAGEIITTTVVSKFLLGFPWVWSLLLGCIMGALSPAVTVPSLVSLQERRYGVAKGIPTMLLAAGGLDNVLCITGFSVFLGIIFSDGNLIVTIFKGPIGVVVGILYGFVAGIFLWYFPSKHCANNVFFRYTMLICAGLIAIFGSSEVGLSGAGPIGCLTTATVAAYKWRKQRQPGETDEVAAVMALTWLIVQHFLFGLIGSAVCVNKIQSHTAGLGIATLVVGLVVRSVISFHVTLGTGFNVKERVFVTLTWLSKATVQAAIGGMALDTVLKSDNPDPEAKRYATDVLTISVLAIIICAPVGATLMAILGPRFLVQGDHEDVRSEDKSVEKDLGVTESDEVTVIAEKVTVVTEKAPRESIAASETSADVRTINDQNFKTELSLILKNRSSKLNENETDVNHVTENIISASYENNGIDNPCFIETEDEADLEITDLEEPSNQKNMEALNTENTVCPNEKEQNSEQSTLQVNNIENEKVNEESTENIDKDENDDKFTSVIEVQVTRVPHDNNNV